MSKLTIENIGGDPLGVCDYRITKNDAEITTFKHDRSQGMSQLLLSASKAVDKVNWDELYNRMGGL